MSNYDFDQITDRRNTGSLKWDVAEGELPMWVADMDFQTAPAVREAIEKRAAHGVFGYTDVEEDWYQAYMDWWERRHQFSIKKEWLTFCTGVVPAISSTVRKLTTPGENVLIQTPVYNIFFNSIVNNGRNVVECPLAYDGEQYEMDFEALEEKLSDPQTSLMILCNHQHAMIIPGHFFLRFTDFLFFSGIFLIGKELMIRALTADLVQRNHQPDRNILFQNV